jgi:hypothetical protein
MTGMSNNENNNQTTWLTSDDDPCVVCSEAITYCGCLRCQECEELSPNHDGPDVACVHCGGELY